jgi:hypothetical protein
MEAFLRQEGFKPMTAKEKKLLQENDLLGMPEE